MISAYIKIETTLIIIRTKMLGCIFTCFNFSSISGFILLFVFVLSLFSFISSLLFNVPCTFLYAELSGAYLLHDFGFLSSP